MLPARHHAVLLAAEERGVLDLVQHAGLVVHSLAIEVEHLHGPALAGTRRQRAAARLSKPGYGAASFARGLHVYQWYVWQKNAEYSPSLSVPVSVRTGFGRYVVQ